jgi:preprotein translocase subunit SecA
MFASIAKKIFGSRNDRRLKKFTSIVEGINKLEPALTKLSDEQLFAQTEKLKQKFKRDGKESQTLIEEAFATIREASIRSLKLRHFDTQMVGGLVLSESGIAEMGTGEGKTLVATLPSYLNVIKGKSVHIVTVNDYLAKRDRDEISKLFDLLGVSVGCNQPNLTKEEKRDVYGNDIVYGTNSEFGFDYLRDNLIHNKADRNQQGLEFCLVDEVDSILIDEARTPLVISGAIEDSVETYQTINSIVKTLTDSDVEISEKEKGVQLNNSGFEKMEEMLKEAGFISDKSDLYGMSGLTTMHYVNASLKANFVFKKDVDYLIKDNAVMIIDEFTGRAMVGRRWSNGLHQAVEAKEGVEIHPENETVASITYQNFFRMYSNLSGMTGTADTEAPEFMDIYGLEVVCVPNNKPKNRSDEEDKMYTTKEIKYKAIIKDIETAHKKNQPVLVGTPSVEVSEVISNMLKTRDLPHNVLNAKNHAREADIIKSAGDLGAITIATNMAGRGTDIKLGGDDNYEAVKAAGGLRVVGVERQDNRRLDNQLRGRSGRQGDIGSTCFYVSPEDSLMRLFGGDKIKDIMIKLGATDEAIEHRFLSKGVTNAQKKIEGHNYDARKNIIRYDDVANKQRKHIYEIRNKILNITPDEIDNYINSLTENRIRSISEQAVASNQLLEDNFEEEIAKEVSDKVGFSVEYSDSYAQDMCNAFVELNEDINTMTGGGAIEHKRGILLSNLDKEWVAHIKRSDELKSSVNLRGYAQKDPIKEFEIESFSSFTLMLESMTMAIINEIFGFYAEGIRLASEQPDNPGWLVNIENKK